MRLTEEGFTRSQWFCHVQSTPRSHLQRLKVHQARLEHARLLCRVKAAKLYVKITELNPAWCERYVQELNTLMEAVMLDNRRRSALTPAVRIHWIILRSGVCHEEMSFTELWRYATMLKLLFKNLSPGSKVLEFKVDIKTSSYIRCACQNKGAEHKNAKP
jgi:hypothetical protein